MSFSYDLATTIGQIRLHIADTDSAAYAFEDAELTYLYSLEGTVKDAAILALKILLTDTARRARRFSLNGLNIDDTAQVQALKTALEMLGGNVAEAGSVFIHFPPDRGYDRTVIQ
ncbi:MAG: hypothetical protein AAFV53_31775 [Myxococcota bacterium]